MPPPAVTPSRMTGADTCRIGISIRTGADRASGAAVGAVTGSGAEVPTPAGISRAAPVSPPPPREWKATRAPPIIRAPPRMIAGARRRRWRPSS